MTPRARGKSQEEGRAFPRFIIVGLVALAVVGCYQAWTRKGGSAADEAAGGADSAAHAEPDAARPAEYVQHVISHHRVAIFSKSYCPFSMRGKELMRRYLGEAGVKVVELDELPNESELQDELETITGARTVPRIFVDGRCLGGADDVSALEAKGELEQLLKRKGLI